VAEEDAGRTLCARWGLKFGTSDRGTAGEVEKGQRGWVIYFPPARHNLSRGFSREHAESAAIEEEAGRRVWRAENRKRVGSSEGKSGKRVLPSLLLMLAAGGIKEPM